MTFHIFAFVGMTQRTWPDKHEAFGLITTWLANPTQSLSSELQGH